MAQKATLLFTSQICLEIWLTPWATAQEWCFPPRTGTMTTIRIPTVPTTSQVQHMHTWCTCVLRMWKNIHGYNEYGPCSISCTRCNFCFVPGGWWYNACGDTNLNGRYLRMRPKGRRRGIQWKPGRRASYSLKLTQISVMHVVTPSLSSSNSASSEAGVFHWCCINHLQCFLWAAMISEGLSSRKMFPSTTKSQYNVSHVALVSKQSKPWMHYTLRSGHRECRRKKSKCFS